MNCHRYLGAIYYTIICPMKFSSPEAWRSHWLKHCVLFLKCKKKKIKLKKKKTIYLWQLILTIIAYYILLDIAAVQISKSVFVGLPPPFPKCLYTKILQRVYAWGTIYICSMCKSHLRSLSSRMIINTEAGVTEMSVEVARTLKNSKEASTALSWKIVMSTHCMRLVVPAVKVNTWFRLS